ncbi:MAG: thiamine-phosphate kinase, partial [Candidatus Rokubacteria bacterium]|nr:thiamine-phosphate kinase [Candidatus Rokubacteria bacterium]
MTARAAKAAPVQELALIRAVRAKVERGEGVKVGIGDDCAVLEPSAGAALLVTTDLLLEDVHFRRRYTEPADIGWKALAVNLSDVAAMG